MVDEVEDMGLPVPEDVEEVMKLLLKKLLHLLQLRLQNFQVLSKNNLPH